MIHHIMKFDNRAGMGTALDGEGVTNGRGRLHRYINQDESAVWQFDASRIAQTSIITAEAVWDHSDPDNPVLTSPRVVVSGLFIMIALDRLSNDLVASGDCYLAYDGSGGTIRHRDAAVPVGAFVSPIFAGSVGVVT